MFQREVHSTLGSDFMSRSQRNERRNPNERSSLNPIHGQLNNVSVSQSAGQSISQSACQSVCLSAYLSICLSVFQILISTVSEFVNLSRQSVRIRLYMSLSLAFSLSLSISLSFPFTLFSILTYTCSPTHSLTPP